MRREEPLYETRRVPSGRYRTEYYTETLRTYGQVGTTVKWILEKDAKDKADEVEPPSDPLADKEDLLIDPGSTLHNAFLTDPEDVALSMPEWLAKGTCPPNFTKEKWEDLEGGLRRLILMEYQEMWENREEIPGEDPGERDVAAEDNNTGADYDIVKYYLEHLGDLSDDLLAQGFDIDLHKINVDNFIDKPDCIASELWAAMSTADKLFLAFGQSHKMTRLTLLPDVGVILRSSPEVGDNLVASIEKGWISFWDGKVEVDSQGRTWLYVSFPGGQSGWMAWHEADGETYLELTPEGIPSKYDADCSADDSYTN